MTCLNNLSVFQLIWVICCWSNVSEVTRSIQGRDGQRYPGFVVQHLCKDFNMFFGTHLRTLNTDWFVQKYYSVSFLNFFKFIFSVQNMNYQPLKHFQVFLYLKKWSKVNLWPPRTSPESLHIFYKRSYLEVKKFWISFY